MLLGEEPEFHSERDVAQSAPVVAREWVVLHVTGASGENAFAGVMLSQLGVSSNQSVKYQCWGV